MKGKLKRSKSVGDISDVQKPGSAQDLKQKGLSDEQIIEYFAETIRQKDEDLELAAELGLKLSEEYQELQKYSTELENKVASFESILTQETGKSSQLDIDNKFLKKDNQTSLDQQEEVTQENSILIDENGNLRAQNQLLQQQLQKSRPLAVELERLKVEKDALIELHGTKQDLTVGNESLEDAIAKNQTILSKQEQKISSGEDKHREITSAISFARQDLSRVTHELKMAQTAIKSVAEQKRVLDEKILEVQDRKLSAELELKQLQAEVGTLKSQKTTLSSEVSGLESEKRREEIETQKLREEGQRLDASNHQKSAELEQTTKALEEKKAEYLGIQQGLQVLGSDTKTSQETLTRTNEQRLDEEKKLAELKSQHSALLGEHETIESVVGENSKLKIQLSEKSTQENQEITRLKLELAELKQAAIKTPETLIENSSISSHTPEREELVTTTTTQSADAEIGRKILTQEEKTLAWKKVEESLKKFSEIKDEKGINLEEVKALHKILKNSFNVQLVGNEDAITDKTKKDILKQCCNTIKLHAKLDKIAPEQQGRIAKFMHRIKNIFKNKDIQTIKDTTKFVEKLRNEKLNGTEHTQRK